MLLNAAVKHLRERIDFDERQSDFLAVKMLEIYIVKSSSAVVPMPMFVELVTIL